MKQLRLLLTICALGFLWTSCETDVDLFADPDETAVVFGFLDQSSPVQYIRINPTFIGEGDASTLAGDTNVTNYGTGEIEVKLLNLSTDAVYTLEESHDIKLEDEGLFNPNMKMYKLETPVDTNAGGFVTNTVIIPGDNYRLSIKHFESGKVFWSDITMGDINALDLTRPDADRERFVPTTFIQFKNELNYIDYQFKFTGIPYAKRYLVAMKYYYTEAGDDTLSKDKFVEIKLGEVEVEGDENAFVVAFSGERFYSILQQRLSANTPALNRIGRKIDIFITAFGPEINTYMNVQNASQTGISQERPSYSNINNGLGVFSFRSTRVFENFLPEYFSAVHVAEGPYTRELFNCALHGSGNVDGVKYCRK